MAELTTTLNCSDLVKTIYINVSIIGYNKLRVKMWVGKFLIKLGIRIIGANVKMEVNE